MKVLKGQYKTIKNSEPLTIAIGNFDGVHLAHRSILLLAKEFTDTKVGLLTFSPHPQSLFDKNHKIIMSDGQKEKVCRELALDYLITITFTREFANLSTFEFIDFLKDINVKRIVVGSDFHFAKNAKGTIADLKTHFEVVIASDYYYKNELVSTSFIKKLLQNNRISVANRILGSTYQITGKVVHGNKVGETLGFPTANLEIGNYHLPGNGVYDVDVFYDETKYRGVLNIGTNPTITSTKETKIEVYILDFNERIYGKMLTLAFNRFLRPETKFHSREDLIEKIQKDLKQIQNYDKIN